MKNKSFLKSRLYILCVFVSVHIFFPIFPEIKVFAQPPDDAYENYIRLKKIHNKWNTAPFKGTRYYKSSIKKYLISIIGREITTDYNYILISPEGRYEKAVICNLYIDRGLQIKGDIKQEDLKKIVENNPSLLKNWWRSGRFLSISGRLNDFKLETDKYGELIILCLKNIKIKESEKNDP